MRIPLSKPWRAFEEFDGLSDEECRKHMQQVLLRHPALVGTYPVTAAVAAIVIWIGVWAGFGRTRWLAPFVPPTLGMQVVVLIVTTVAVGALAYFFARDHGLYLGLRRELHVARCPKCRQSLLGLPIQTVGVDPDPGKQFVRCPECGRKHALLELGLSPRDLVPFEHRVVDPRFAAKRLRQD